MEKIVKERRFFYILTLILLAGFLYFPSFCLADNFEEINIEELGKYLELPDEKVEQLLHSLINIFYSEWINLEGSGYSTAEQMAVPIIMREAIRVQALSHLLVDAPIEIVKGIVKTAVEIAKIVMMCQKKLNNIMMVILTMRKVLRALFDIAIAPILIQRRG
jgi:hypothetical protein